LEDMRSNGDGDDKSSWIALLFWQGIVYHLPIDGCI
jgi:hypothetical protein